MKFGQWETTTDLPVKKNGKWYLRCQCSCGFIKEVYRHHLTSGVSTKCRRCACTTHGDVRTSDPIKQSTYSSWRNMKVRCNNPSNHPAHKCYRDTPVTLDSRWKSYTNFLADMGYKPSITHSIDRVDPNNPQYSKGNCRWATALEQIHNRRTSVNDYTSF